MTLQITQYVVTAVALTAFGVMLLLLSAPWLYGKLRRCGLFFVFIAAGFLYSMATKPPTCRVYYDGGIKPGATANVVTNDTVAIYWQRDTSGGVYVPETATVYIDYRPNTETNAEWGLLAQTTVGAWGWSGTVENATNYDYNVWAYYIPPEPVHTNGVWTYKTHFDRNGEYALPLRARVEVNGVAIATPAEKRKDAEKRPYDAEVEWISGSGAYVDTGVDTADNVGFRVTAIRMVDTTADVAVFGARLNNGNTRCFVGAQTLGKWYFGWNTRIDYGSIDLNTPHTLGLNFFNNRKATFDDSEAGNLNGTITFSRRLFLPGYHRPEGTIDTASGEYYRLCGCQITKGNTLVRDFIPVRVGTTGALYDRRGVGGMNPDGTARNDGMYFNRGTGDFGYGNDK